MATTAVRPRRRGDHVVILRSRRLGWSARVHTRAVVVTLVVLGASMAVLTWSLTVGDFPISIGKVAAALLGHGSKESTFIVDTLRLPRSLAALLVGTALGMSGAIFQSVARNPLASPDIIGVNAGAAASAVFVIVVLHGSPLQITAGALVGSGLTALGIYVLAYKKGVSGYRLVLVGIGVTAMLASVTSYLLTRAQIVDAHDATVWLTGDLNGRGWNDARPVALALTVLVPTASILGRHLRMLELGDDTATALGSRVEHSRAALLLSGTALAALGTAAAGPVAFVALIAPQVARRLVGTRSPGLLPAAACGAFLVAASDLAGRRIFAPTELPVGVITAILGAPYLLFLLARANQVGSGG